MTRRFFSLLCGLALMLAAGSVHARADHREAPRISPRTETSINWGVVSSRGRMEISGLPAVQSAREAARLKTRKGTRAAPGERLNRPVFGASPRDKASGLPTGKRQHKPVSLVKPVDSASPLIQKAYRTRRPLPRVVLKGRDTSGKNLHIELKTVRITSYSISKAGPVAKERITLVYKHIRWMR